MTEAEKEQIKKQPGVQQINGNWYNQYGVCLDCNEWQVQCLHQNLIEEGGQLKCRMCGFVVQ